MSVKFHFAVQIGDDEADDDDEQKILHSKGRVFFKATRFFSSTSDKQASKQTDLPTRANNEPRSPTLAVRSRSRSCHANVVQRRRRRS